MPEIFARQGWVIGKARCDQLANQRMAGGGIDNMLAESKVCMVTAGVCYDRLIKKLLGLRVADNRCKWRKAGAS